MTYDIMGVAESRLDDAVDDHIVNIDGYTILRQDRNTEGGGVIVYIRNTLRAQILAQSKTAGPGKPLKPEYVICKVWADRIPPILICLVYRPPKISFNDDSDFLDNLRDLCSTFSHKVIIGDFNADLLKSTPDSDFIRSIADELSLQVINHGATNRPPKRHRVTNSPASLNLPPRVIEPTTWIDLIFVDNNDNILSYNNKIAPFHTSHNLIDVEIKLFIPKPPNESFSFRKLNDITPEAINEFLTGCEWAPFSTSEFKIKPALKCLTSNLQLAIDQLAPLKTITPKRIKPPWINDEIQLLISKHKATERHYVRFKDLLLLNELVALSNQIEVLSDTARCSFYQEQISNAFNNNQDIWRELRHLGLLPKPKSELHGFLPDDINAHFAGVSTSSSENLADVEELISNASTDGFKFDKVTLNDVILAVAHFSSQATGDDAIPQRVIARSLPTIGPLLVVLFNVPLESGIFPIAWKKSLLVAIKKTSIPSSVSDFRPVALLCFLSKVLEKLAHDQITSYLRSNKLLDPLQTGFRQFSNTETVLIKLTDDIRRGISNRLVTFLLQFDFSKAFDTVSPTKLLIKLKDMGFSRMVLLWIKSYLKDRQLQVISKTSSSDTLITNLGVLQGSVLGPLLFCIYINDLGLHLPQGVLHLLYADDLQVYIQVPPEDALLAVDTLTHIASKVSDWADSASLYLNHKKTMAIYFSTSTFVDRINKLNLEIEVGKGVRIPFSEEVKSLGVMLDNKLTWSSQIISVEKKVNKLLYSLRFIRHFTTEKLRILLFQALVTPHLDYCNTVYLDACITLKARIQRLSNCSIRYIFGIRKYEHVSPYRRQLNWLCTDTRRLYFTGIIIYKILRLQQPPYLIDLFTKYIPKHKTRSILFTKELKLPTIKGCGSSSFQLHGTIFWNSIPYNIRVLSCLNSFKTALMKYLLSLDP